MAMWDGLELMWPDSEAVSYQHRTGGGSTTTTSSIGHAVASDLSRSEIISGSAFLTADDVLWIIPARELAAGVSPKEGDRIVAGSVGWTVLSARQVAKGTEWECTAKKER